MIKTFSPVGWSFDGPNFSLVKCASRGLRGHDWTQFVKRAGVEVAQAFAPFFKDAEFKDGDYPVHCLALGAHETWGPNWNGDTFTRKAAERYHPTFVKFAKWFRNHKNKPDSPFYGRVKASAYNPTMDRIELLVALNGTKEAADRNGGFVADREIQKLASGKDIAVSMACLVPHDVCSACGNQAPKRDDYCTASTCPGGGCKEALTKLYKEGQDTKQLFVYNPTPKFFDITNVESDRPADRTAYAAPADWLSKSAADTWAQWPGAEAAEAQNITAPLEVLADRDSQFLNDAQRQIAKVATGLAALETQAPISEFALRGIPSYRTLSEAPLVSTKEACQWLAAWADQGIILPLSAFASFTKRASCANAARAHLPGLYGRLLSSGVFDSGLRDNPYTLLDSVPGLQQKQAAYQLAPSLSLHPDHVQRRAMLAIFGQQPVPAVIGSTHEKQASIETPETAKLLRDYAIYKAASLTRMLLSGSLGDAALLTSQLAVCQDRLL